MKKWLLFTMALILFTPCVTAQGYIDVVKNTKNAAGMYCSDIPSYVENKMGFKVINSEWLEKKENGSVLVSLKVSAQKENKLDTVYFSYGWRPEWVWLVDPNTKSVSPVNTLADKWMKGKL